MLRRSIEVDGTLRVQVVHQRRGTSGEFEGYDGDTDTADVHERDAWGAGIEWIPRALVVTAVLFEAAYRRDNAHEDALPTLTGIDSAELPDAAILDYVLAETLIRMTAHAGHDPAVDFLDRVEENARFHIDSLTADGFATANARFRQHERFSFVDAGIVASMQAEGLGYLYAFDDDFDGDQGGYRLDSARSPHQPE